LQLLLLRLLELEISFSHHGVERARLLRRLDAGADRRSAKTTRVVDHEPDREPRHDRVLQVLQFLRYFSRGAARLARLTGEFAHAMAYRKSKCPSNSISA
jgi:hypothetical protein